MCLSEVIWCFVDVSFSYDKSDDKILKDTFMQNLDKDLLLLVPQVRKRPLSI